MPKTNTKRCSCRYLDHEPTDCPYEAGCTGCICERQDHAGAQMFCETCEHWTVHPDQHDHRLDLEEARQDARDSYDPVR